MHSGSRPIRLFPADPIQALERLHAVSDSDPSERAGSFIFEFDFEGSRKAIVCAEALSTIAVYRTETEIWDRAAGTRHRRPNHGPAGTGLLREVQRQCRTRLDGISRLGQSLFWIAGYDAVRPFEPRLDQSRRRGTIPDLWAVLPRVALVFDIDTGEGHLVVNSTTPPGMGQLEEWAHYLRGTWPRSNGDDEAKALDGSPEKPAPASGQGGMPTWASAVPARMPTGASAVPAEMPTGASAVPARMPTGAPAVPARMPTWASAVPDFEPRLRVGETEFAAAVERAKEFIRSGDIFQVVLSVESETRTEQSAASMYRRMREVNPRTANYLAQGPGFTLIGASPEILVEKRGRECVIRPLAGTRPHSGPRDPAAEARLLSDDKDCAEHRMLVDLARNDLGRVCRAGSVHPNRLMTVEYFYNVMHISSEIRGEIRPDRDALEALVAGFPAGTMTGAPKIRAMEIIDELESIPRGFYSGGIGFLTPEDDLYSYIVIRSLMLQDGTAYSRAGAGIVFDSEPAKEYQECLNKLRNAWRAISG